jgi:hypothetical protein
MFDDFLSLMTKLDAVSVMSFNTEFQTQTTDGVFISVLRAACFF